jgi:hypothetical protein
VVLAIPIEVMDVLNGTARSSTAGGRNESPTDGASFHVA